MGFREADNTALNDDEAAVTPTDAETGIQPADDNAADSSAAETDANTEDKKSLLDVVQDAVSGDDGLREESSTSDSDTKDSEASASEEEKPKEGEDAQASEDDLGDDSEEATRYDSIPRFQQLKDQRDQFRKERDEIAEKMSGFEDRAERFDKIQTYMSENQLTDADASRLFGFGAMVKNDPAQAVQFLEGYLQDLRVAIGQALPSDLQDQVDQGLVFEDTARELSAARSEAARLQRENEQLAAQREQTEQQTAQSAVTTAVDTWEAEVTATDPDYRSIKQPLVQNALVALVAQKGQPATPDAAKALAQEALESVNTQLLAMRPKRQPTTPANSSAGQSSTKAAPEPQTLLEVVTQAANG